MKTIEDMEQAVSTYIQAFEDKNLEAIIALFSSMATVEDPVGTPSHIGIEAIKAFYAKSIATGAVLKQQGATRIAGNYAAFAFNAVVPGMGHVEVIDLFRFDEDGKIIEMRAFFSPKNFKQA